MGAAASGVGQDWGQKPYLDLDLDQGDWQEEVRWQVLGLAGRLAHEMDWGLTEVVDFSRQLS